MIMSENNPHAPVIAIDGPSGSGKGTICQLLAANFDWRLLDSGALYRLVALSAENHGLALDDAAALEVLAGHLDVEFRAGDHGEPTAVILEGEDVSLLVRSEECGRKASIVAVLPEVRKGLLKRQRAFAEAPGLVADGRDMGTVVFPDATLKIFLTASEEERANRRYKQLKAKGQSVSLPGLLADIRERDQRDSERELAPLKPADDAVVMDTTSKTIDEVFQLIVDEARSRHLI